MLTCASCGREYERPEGRIYTAKEIIDLCHPMDSVGPTCYSVRSSHASEDESPVHYLDDGPLPPTNPGKEIAYWAGYRFGRKTAKMEYDLSQKYDDRKG